MYFSFIISPPHTHSPQLHSEAGEKQKSLSELKRVKQAFAFDTWSSLLQWDLQEAMILPLFCADMPQIPQSRPLLQIKMDQSQAANYKAAAFRHLWRQRDADGFTTKTSQLALQLFLQLSLMLLSLTRSLSFSLSASRWGRDFTCPH